MYLLVVEDDARIANLAVQAPEPAPTLEADPDRLRQVLLILLDNALKHTPSGGKVTVGVRREERHVAFEVADTGSGIAPEHLPRLFERFYRADAARGRVEGGSGLGLAIAKSLVEAHAGELAAESAPGRGTRMTIRLPLDPSRPSLPDRLGELAARITHARPR
ncbi:MAG TPA: ATP-binding protein [Chloroflexota bacterium]|jgi:signal transduction histidine kinase